MLSPDEISRFVADGYVAVRGAIPPDVTRACQDIIWAELAPHGVLRDDPATWTRPVLRINTPSGSHRDVPPILAPGGDDGMPWLPAAQQAAQASAHRPTAWATGRAGDVFLCHPFLVHAASWPHRGRSAKMMAQPPVLLTDGQFPWPAARILPPTPVEQAIFNNVPATPS